MRDHYTKFAAEGKVLINDKRGNWVGECVILDEDQKSVYIKSFEVYEKWHRMGYGTLLMNSVFERFFDKEAVSLHVETINEAAIAFYRGLGFFVAVATVHRGWDMTDCRPHYLMTRRLAHAA
jgi:ribosomal protein S18 acetylase RimI-like enzyme